MTIRAKRSTGIFVCLLLGLTGCFSFFFKYKYNFEKKTQETLTGNRMLNKSNTTAPHAEKCVSTQDNNVTIVTIIHEITPLLKKEIFVLMKETEL